MSQLDLLAIGSHPDDVELACGATLALTARQGLRVGILHLTRGERGTQGTSQQRLAEAASFYSGLAARGNRSLAAHRPAAVFSYMQHHSFEPSFVVDVTAAWEAKMAALAAYRSQLFPLPQPHLPSAPNHPGSPYQEA